LLAFVSYSLSIEKFVPEKEKKNYETQCLQLQSLYQRKDETIKELEEKIQQLESNYRLQVEQLIQPVVELKNRNSILEECLTRMEDDDDYPSPPHPFITIRQRHVNFDLNLSADETSVMTLKTSKLIQESSNNSQKIFKLSATTRRWKRKAESKESLDDQQQQDLSSFLNCTNMETSNGTRTRDHHLMF
jgi:hypothetical protein